MLLLRMRLAAHAAQFVPPFLGTAAMAVAIMALRIEGPHLRPSVELLADVVLGTGVYAVTLLAIAWRRVVAVIGLFRSALKARRRL